MRKHDRRLDVGGLLSRVSTELKAMFGDVAPSIVVTGVLDITGVEWDMGICGRVIEEEGGGGE